MSVFVKDDDKKFLLSIDCREKTAVGNGGADFT